MNIGIVGYGVVGRAISAYYEGKQKLWYYDKATDGPEALAELNANAEVVFICVGTPYKAEEWRVSAEKHKNYDHSPGGLDCSQVYAAVDALTGEKTVIIKSTVNPGVTDDIQAKHPEHRVFFVPEFLSEQTAAEDYASPRRRHVVGLSDMVVQSWNYDNLCARQVRSLLPTHYDVIPGSEEVFDGKPVYLCARQAELLKLATNSFYALKVTYANMLYDCGMAQETLDALGADNWIGGEHFEVEHKGFRGFGGKCLPKDLLALADYARRYIPDGYLEEVPFNGSLCEVLKNVHAYNTNLLNNQHIDVNDFLGACKV
jgi:UDPglucose 6-dehydrogenase